MVYHALKILQREGYLDFTEEVDNPSRIFFTVNRDELYKFQVANASLDGFIKLLLRSHTGLFSGYVIVDEELLAKRAGITHEKVYEFLKHLRKNRIIDYVPKNNTPYVFFLKERINTDRLKISKENYDHRKADYLTRITSVIEYATGKTICRSQLLTRYFGENDTPACGKCDVCQAVRVLEISGYEFREISEEVQKILENPCT